MKRVPETPYTPYGAWSADAELRLGMLEDASRAALADRSRVLRFHVVTKPPEPSKLVLPGPENSLIAPPSSLLIGVDGKPL